VHGGYDRRLLGWVVYRFMVRTGMTPRRVAAFLGVPPERLPDVALCARPDPTGGNYEAQLLAICQAYGTNYHALAHLCSTARVDGRAAPRS
jgi:hypothetical protein